MGRLFLILACGSLLGCAGTGSKANADSGSVRPVEELPEDYRELWLSYIEDRPDWPERRAAALQDPGQEVFLVSNLMRTLLRSFARGTLGKSEDPVTMLYRRTGNELVALGPAAAPALAELLSLGNGQGPIMAGELLERIGAPALDSILEQLAREDHVDARRRAAVLLERMPYGLEGREDAVRAGLIARIDDDPDWLVRDRCVLALTQRALRDTTIQEAVRALGRAVFDADKSVRRRAVQGLVDLGGTDGVPALINLLDRSTREADVGGLRISQEALMVLTGHHERLGPSDWRGWWSKHRPVR